MVLYWLQKIRKGRPSFVVVDPGLSIISPIFSSGIIFQACSHQPGLGDNVIAIGGRYDRVVELFRPPTLNKTNDDVTFGAMGLSLAVEKLFQAVAQSSSAASTSSADANSQSASLNCAALIYSLRGPYSELEGRVKLAANLWASGIRAEYRHPARLRMHDLVRHYCRDLGMRWMLEVREHTAKVRVRDVHSTTQSGGIFDVKLSEIASWLLAHSASVKKGASSKADSSDSKDSMHASSTRSVLTIINPKHQKRASVQEAVDQCLSKMGIIGNPIVVAVNLRIMEIRALMNDVLSGKKENNIVPKSLYKPSDARRLLVQHMCRMQSQSGSKSKNKQSPVASCVYIFSMPESKVDVVQL